MRRHAAALLIYLALTIALTWPLAARLSSVVPSDLGDPLLSTWTLWWNAQVLPLTEPWWNGPIFYPAPDALSLSDHRLGIGIISTPILWLTDSPLTAYNVSFLASFFLSACAAYALGFTLTAHHGAAFIAGLVFGFNPFRAGHLSHLELLCSYWLPVSLLALHRWNEARKPSWLVVLSGSLAMQALTSVYYFVFFGVILGLWLLWFMRGRLQLREYAALSASLVAPLALIAPVVLHYRQAHASMSLKRTIADVEAFSADAIGLLTAPEILAVWDSPDGWNRAEGALYPGAVAVAVVLTALIAESHSRAPGTRPWMRRLRMAAILGAGVAACIALVPLLFGPVAADFAGLRISVSEAYKPLSIAFVLFTGWLLSTGFVRAQWHARSPFTFYVVATCAMWLFALGPTAHLFGERVLYKAPYSWLMLIPGVDTAFRAPARFGMLAALTLCAAAALAWVRLVRAVPTRRAVTASALVAVAVAVDSWTEPLALVEPPRTLQIPAEAPVDAVVLELPLGAYEDAAAMYRAMTHERPTANGLSGYAPPHYQVVHSALAEGRVDAMAALATISPLVVFVDREKAGSDLVARLRAFSRARLVRSDATHDVMLIDRLGMEPLARFVPEAGLPLRTPSASVNGDDVAHIGDGNFTTGWLTPTQQGNEEFLGELGGDHRLRGVYLALGPWAGGFPRQVEVLTSTDGAEWTSAWSGDVTALAVRTAVADQRDVGISLPFEGRVARYVRVRQTGWSSVPWAVAEFRAIPE